MNTHQYRYAQQVMTWLLLSITAFLGFGLQNFLYKVAAARQLDSRTVTFYFILVSTLGLWCILAYAEDPFEFSTSVLILAVLDAVFFYTTTVSRIEALRFIPAHLAFPILRGSTVLIAIVGIAFFDETFSWQLFCALALLLLAAYLISADHLSDAAQSIDYRWGLVLTLIALLSSAATNIISKLAAEQTIILQYMTLANTIIIALSYTETRIVKGERIRPPSKEELLVASALAATNLIAWFAYLYALRTGPLSLTAVLSGMGFIVPIVLAAIIYKEQLSRKRMLAVLCTALIIILIHQAKA